MNCKNACGSIPAKLETGHIVTETIVLEGSILHFHDHGRKKMCIHIYMDLCKHCMFH